MKTVLRFSVPGCPVSQGNHRYDPRRHKLYETTKGHAAWRKSVTMVAKNAMQKEGLTMLVGPLGASFVFTFPIPGSHLRKNGHRRSMYPEGKITKPDLSKLVRACEDSLTDADVWEDDSQLIRIEAVKQYEYTPAKQDTEGRGPEPGVVVEVWKL